MGEKSKLRRTISSWANAEDQHAKELRETTRAGRCDLIADCHDRTPVRLRGTLRTVTLRPRGGVPALEAELFDGVRLLDAGVARSPGDRRDLPGPGGGGAGTDRTTRQ
jgi:hypothetical protein